MSERTAVASLFRALAPVLEGFGGRWYVFGAQAVMIWGRPRLTGDVDVTVHIEPDDPGALVARMRDAGFDLRIEDTDDFVRRTRVLPFVHRPTGMPAEGRVPAVGGPRLTTPNPSTGRPGAPHETHIPLPPAEFLL